MRRAGVDEIGKAELPDVSQALEFARVDEAERQRADADVVPERVANDLVLHASRPVLMRRPPAARRIRWARRGIVSLAGLPCGWRRSPRRRTSGCWRRTCS